jgi:hypothetical protein
MTDVEARMTGKLQLVHSTPFDIAHADGRSRLGTSDNCGVTEQFTILNDGPKPVT